MPPPMIMAVRTRLRSPPTGDVAGLFSDIMVPQIGFVWSVLRERPRTAVLVRIRIL